MIDDDGGIDERFDGDDDNDEDDEENFDGDHTSPKAHKPKPLDQTFVP